MVCFHKSLVFTVAIVLSLSPIAVMGQIPGTCPTPIEAELIALVNEARLDNGVAALVIDGRIMIAARRHSDDMATNDFVGHTGSDGSFFFERQNDAGYMQPSGEVIAAGYPTPESVMQAWMGSEGHRNVILYSNSTHIGAGYVNTSSATFSHYYTVDFGGSTDPAEPTDCSCCTERVGDANGLGGDEPTIGDVSVMIDAKFITGTCDGILECFAEADINQSGDTEATCDDVTIGDISTLIDYLFITGPSLGLPDCL